MKCQDSSRLTEVPLGHCQLCWGHQQEIMLITFRNAEELSSNLYVSSRWWPLSHSGSWQLGLCCCFPLGEGEKGMGGCFSSSLDFHTYRTTAHISLKMFTVNLLFLLFLIETVAMPTRFKYFLIATRWERSHCGFLGALRKNSAGLEAPCGSAPLSATYCLL